MGRPQIGNNGRLFFMISLCLKPRADDKKSNPDAFLMVVLGKNRILNMRSFLCYGLYSALCSAQVVSTSKQPKILLTVHSGQTIEWSSKTKSPNQTVGYLILDSYNPRAQLFFASDVDLVNAIRLLVRRALGLATNAFLFLMIFFWLLSILLDGSMFGSWHLDIHFQQMVVDSVEHNIQFHTIDDQFVHQLISWYVLEPEVQYMKNNDYLYLYQYVMLPHMVKNPIHVQ